MRERPHTGSRLLSDCYRTISERALSDYRKRHYRTIGAIGVLSDAIGVYYRNYRTRAQEIIGCGYFCVNGNGYATEEEREERAGLWPGHGAIAKALVAYPFVVPSYDPPIFNEYKTIRKIARFTLAGTLDRPSTPAEWRIDAPVHQPGLCVAGGMAVHGRLGLLACWASRCWRHCCCGTCIGTTCCTGC